jgi:hypothetical protein
LKVVVSETDYIFFRTSQENSEALVTNVTSRQMEVIYPTAGGPAILDASRGG